MFSHIDEIRTKLIKMIRFNNLPEKTKELIIEINKGEFYPVSRESKMKLDVDDLRDRFELCRRSFTPQQQMDIEGIFEEYKTLPITNKTRALRRLAILINTVQNVADEITLTKREIMKILNSKLHGLKKVKEKIAESIIAAKYSGKKGFNILLVGSPGVGKTALAKAIAEVLGRKFFVIPLGTATSMLDVVGDAPSYEASNCGEVAAAFYKAKTTAIVLCLDEFEKSFNAAKEGGKVSTAFNDALSDEAYFKDAFLCSYIKTGNTVFVATANSTETIPENLLNRFTVINIDDYTEEEKAAIGAKYILPELFREFSIKKGEISVSKDVITYIAENFCEDDGARDLKKHLRTIVNKVITEWDYRGVRIPVRITKEYACSVIENYVDADSAIIRFRRNRHLYPPRVTKEIKKLIDKLRRDDLDASLREKYEKKLGYLVCMVPDRNAFSNFDRKRFFRVTDKSHCGMDDVKNTVARIFNVCAMTGKPVTNNKFLFVGPPGCGKSSIGTSMAEGCGVKCVKISLNGVSDEKYIKGHIEAYNGADAGQPVKAVAEMGAAGGIIILDEIDKMSRNAGVAVSNTLVDLLDNSGEFTDNFLGVPVDLSNVLFIATANDISAVDKVLLDRFTVIHLDGYTEKEKEKIISGYIIPKAEKNLCPEDISIEFSEEAKKLLSSVYCRSMGVRDADKAVCRLVEDKLFCLRKDETHAVISADDVEKVLGKPLAERGNFPETVYPGLSKALAVTNGGCGMAFAVETVLIPDDDSFTITGLPRETTVDSVKLAACYIKRNYIGALKRKGIHVHFGEGSVEKDGPSAGVAILMSMLSAAFDTPITENVAYTGEINANGYVFNIGGTLSKIQAAQQSGCDKVFIPQGNYDELTAEELAQFSIEVVPVKHISQVIDSVFKGMPEMVRSA